MQLRPLLGFYMQSSVTARRWVILCLNLSAYGCTFHRRNVVSYAAWLLVHLTVTLDAWRALLFTVQALESEAAWSRFVRNGRVQLRCEVTDCE